MYFKNPILAMELKLKMKNISILVTIILYNVFFALVSMVSLISASDLSNARWDSLAMNSISIFFYLGMLQSMFVFILAPICTASALAGERERGTLDLLLVSPIRTVQIVLEKLAANIFIVLLFSLSSMPILSVGFIFGGVGLRQILFFFFILCLLSFCCISAGIYCSCLVNKSVGAFFLTIFIESLLIVGNGWLVLFLSSVNNFRQIAGLLLFFNPFTLIMWLYDEMTGASMIVSLFRFFFGEKQSVFFMLTKLFPVLCIAAQILIGIGFIWRAVRCIEKTREKERRRIIYKNM